MTGAERASVLDLLKVILYQDLVTYYRYPLNALGGILIFVLTFGVVLAGGTVFEARAITDSLEGIVVGFFLWTFATSAYMGVSSNITSEAQWGTLERHYVTPFGFARVMLAKGVATLATSSLNAIVVFAIMLALSGVTLQVDVLTVVPILATTLVSVVGIGFGVGGLAVIFKQLQQFAALLQFLFIGLISMAALDVWWFRLLPLVQGSSMLQATMTEGTALWEFAPSALGLLVGTSLAYVALGYAAFKLACRRARELGIMGHY